MKPFILLVLCLGLTSGQLAKHKSPRGPVKLDIIPYDDIACSDATRPRVLTDPEGTFTSPNYPGNYINNANCQWLIYTTEPDSVIELSFDYFRTEPDYDGVVINDGNFTSSPVITGFDGSLSVPPTGIKSTGPSMLVRFVTDASVVDTGFSVSYKVVPYDSTPDACYSATRPLVLTDYAGTFTSRGYPDSNYWNYADCQWLIKSQEPGGFVSISFDYFKTEAAYDFLYIFDGDSSSAPMLNRLTGNLGTAGPFQSTGESLFLLFISDQTVSDVGFSAQYTTVAPL